MDNHVHLRINMKCMVALGIFPLKLQNCLLTFLYWTYSQFMRFYLIAFVLAQFVEVYHILGRELFETVSNLGVSLLYAVTIMKVFACRGRRIIKLIGQIRNTEAEIINNGGDDLKKIYFYHVRWNYFADRLLIWVGVFTVLPFYVNPILLQLTGQVDGNDNPTSNGSMPYQEKPLPFSSWFPFDKYRFYYASYAYHVLAGIIGGSMTVATDIFFVGLMVFAIGQIKTLQYAFRNSKRLAIDLIESNPRLSLRDGVKFTIGKCILMHQTIIKYVGDLNESMRLLMLFDFAIASMQMAMLGLQIIVVGFSWQQLFAVEYLAAMLIQLFLFYWHANEILLESTVLSSAIWESDWFDYDRDVKKSLLLVMMRCKRPLVLSVGPFYEMSTQTALAILRAAYSYVAVIRQVYGRKL